MNDKNFVSLLSGKSLLLEVDLNHSDYRCWIEISLQQHLRPSYPFRTELYAMKGHSLYSNMITESEAKFRLRTSYFLASDIEKGFDPSYDRVGKFIEINSVEALLRYLNENHIKLQDFIESSRVDDYPL